MSPLQRAVAARGWDWCVDPYSATAMITTDKGATFRVSTLGSALDNMDADDARRVVDAMATAGDGPHMLCSHVLKSDNPGNLRVTRWWIEALEKL